MKLLRAAGLALAFALLLPFAYIGQLFLSMLAGAMEANHKTYLAARESIALIREEWNR